MNTQAFHQTTERSFISYLILGSNLIVFTSEVLIPPIQQITLMHMIKSFKKWIFKRMEFINITKSYQTFIIIKTHRALESFSDHKELNKSNNFKNDLKSIHS